MCYLIPPFPLVLVCRWVSTTLVTSWCSNRVRHIMYSFAAESLDQHVEDVHEASLSTYLLLPVIRLGFGAVQWICRSALLSSSRTPPVGDLASPRDNHELPDPRALWSVADG